MQFKARQRPRLDVSFDLQSNDASACASTECALRRTVSADRKARNLLIVRADS